MIKLNTQGDNTSPQLRTVLETGEQVSFLDRMSALAQKAISRLTGTGFAGGSFSRITKMIPAVMLAVFAFSAANAQLLTTNFSTTTPHANITATAFSGGSVANAGCGLSQALTSGGSPGTYTFSVTLTADAGYQFTVTSVESEMRKIGIGGTNGNVTVSVDGSSWGSSSNVSSLTCFNVNRTGSAGPFTTATITWSGTDANGGVALDNVEIDGVVSAAPPACTPPSTQGLTNNGPLCSSSSTQATIGLAGSENGVTYELLNASSSVVGTLVSTTTGAQNFTGTYPAGTYTVRAFNTTTTSCSTAVVGTTTVATITTPTVSFVSNNDPICIGGKAIYQITGTAGATVNYTVTVNGGTPSAQQSVTLDPVTGAGTIEYTHTTGSAGTVVVNLVSVTLNSCSNVLNPQPASTVNVRDALVVSNVTAAQTICSGGTFTKIGYTLTGSGYARTVYYRINGGSTQTMVVPVGQTTVGVSSAYALPVSSLATTNAGPSDLVHTIVIDSVVYNAGTGNCKAVVGTSVSLTVKAAPTFDFKLNGSILALNPNINYICVPTANVNFSITTPNGGTYTIVKDGVTLGSGSVSSGTTSLLPGVNLNPGGAYVVTLTGSNGCPTVQNYTVQEVNKATFVYTINGQTITNGSTVTVCAGDAINFSLSGTNGANYSVGGTIGSWSGTLGSAAATWNTTKTAGTYTGTLNVSSVPVLGGCNDSISYTVNVVANPVVAGNVTFNGTTVANNNNYEVCENNNVSIRIYGNVGDFVEIWRNEGSSANFTAVGSQVGTFVIPSVGYYTYSFNAGPWASNHESTSNFRDWFRVEVKHPTTLCKSSIDFNVKITQKPRVTLSYTEGTPVAPVANAVAINNNDTVRVCFPTNVRVFFNRHSSNIAGDIDYVFTKDGNHAANGTIVTAQALGADYYELPVSAGAAGWYTLSATGVNGCDSAIRFYLKPNAKPVYTFVQTGTGTTPGDITFCEGYPKGITLTGSSTLTQKYAITRTAGPGTAVEFNGNLTASAVSHIFAGLAPGTHNYTLTVTANTGVNECVTAQNFRVIVTEMPKPVLQANGLTRVDGATYEYCEGEVVEYTIAAVPVGSQYTLSRTNGLGTFVIGTGGTVANQASVVTVVSNATNAGVYTLKVTNNGTDVCDTTMSFTVVVNDRPDLTYIDHSNMLDCYGATTGWVRYAYSGTANMFHTYIVDVDANDTVQTHNSNLQSQANVLHSNLAAGNYKLILTTDKGCDTSFTFTIGQPASAVSVNITGTQSACDGSLGSVTFSVGGGTPGYSVVITNSATNVIATQFTQPNPFSGYNVANLPAATYTVTVTDSKGCIGTASFTVNDCAAADLVPFADDLGLNASIASTTPIPFTMDVYNIGGTTSAGNIGVTVKLPAGYALTDLGSAWTVTTQTGNVYRCITTQTIAKDAKITLAGNITKTGTPTLGFFAVVAEILSGSGGETNVTNSALVYLFNIQP